MGQKRLRISVCTSCKVKGESDRPGFALLDALRASLAENPNLRDGFEVGGVACMAGCNRPCAVGFHGQGKASYLFGDLETGADVDDLLRFARQYDALHDGWCSSVDRPGKLRKSTLARIPATLFDVPYPREAAE